LKAIHNVFTYCEVATIGAGAREPCPAAAEVVEEEEERTSRGENVAAGFGTDPETVVIDQVFVVDCVTLPISLENGIEKTGVTYVS
jgi:hypothetical protein